MTTLTRAHGNQSGQGVSFLLLIAHHLSPALAAR